MGDENNPFTEEELTKMNENFQKKRNFFEKHPEKAIKCSEERIKKDNEGFLEFLKKYENPIGSSNSFDVEPHYKFSEDILCMSIEKDYQPSVSIKLEENVYLDFNNDMLPIALKIMNASKTFNLVKNSFENILAFKMRININFKSITVNASFLFKTMNKKEEKQISPHIANNWRLPAINAEAGLAIV